MKSAHRRRLAVVYNHRYRLKLRARGLTIYGLPRKTHSHNLPRASDPETVRANDRARYLFRRERNYAKCLTARGIPRQVFSSLTEHELRERDILRKRKRRQNYIAHGLTANGTPRKRRSNLSPLELAWREFRSTIQLPEQHDWLDFATHASQLAAA